MIQKLNDVQRECRDGVQARDVDVKLNVLLKALFQMASELKNSPEMSSATFNAAAVQYFLDPKRKS